MAVASVVEQKQTVVPPLLQGSGVAAYIFIGLPLLLVALCFAAKLRIRRDRRRPARKSDLRVADRSHAHGHADLHRAGPHCLDLCFYADRSPGSRGRTEAVHGHQRFEIMAVPFFILAGSFLTHGGVARRMIDFATSVVGHWHGGLALAGIVAARCLPWCAGRALRLWWPSARSCCRRWSGAVIPCISAPA